MDSQTKHVIWVLAISAMIIEMPFVASKLGHCEIQIKPRGVKTGQYRASAHRTAWCRLAPDQVARSSLVNVNHHEVTSPNAAPNDLRYAEVGR
jgi:hypothetical protein